MIKKRLVTILFALSLSSALLLYGCDEEEIDITSEEVIEEVVETVTEDNTEDENSSANADEEIDENKEETVGQENTEDKETTDTTETSDEIKEEASKEEEAFHVEAADILLYVKKAVNVRTGPNTNYERIGSLEKGTDVEVTGVADTGWYRIKYNGQTGYVSNKFLITEDEYNVLVAAEKAAAEAAKLAQKMAQEGTSEVTASEAAKMAQEIVQQQASKLTEEQLKELTDQITNQINNQVQEEAAKVQAEAQGQAANQGAAAQTSGIDASRVVALCNEYRANAGLGGLTEDATLDAMAAVRAQEIASSFSHTRPDGRDCSSILDDYGYAWSAWGENIAAGQTSADEVMNSWMNSEGHKANILSGNYGRIGVACYADPNSAYGYYWVQIFSN